MKSTELSSLCNCFLHNCSRVGVTAPVENQQETFPSINGNMLSLHVQVYRNIQHFDRGAEH